MKFLLLDIKEFDVKQERKRINKAFKNRPKIRQRLHKIVDLFIDEKFNECLKEINKMGYDKKHEISEKEYLPIFVSDALNTMGFAQQGNPFISAEKLSRKDKGDIIRIFYKGCYKTK